MNTPIVILFEKDCLDYWRELSDDNKVKMTYLAFKKRRQIGGIVLDSHDKIYKIVDVIYQGKHISAWKKIFNPLVEVTILFEETSVEFVELKQMVLEVIAIEIEIGLWDGLKKSLIFSLINESKTNADVYNIVGSMFRQGALHFDFTYDDE
jgi:hypothetical protein